MEQLFVANQITSGKLISAIFMLLMMSLAGTSASLANEAAPDSAAQRPNILLIMADDLGVETLGTYGGESYQTPALDDLAAQGMRFEQGHATPLCSPSRVMLLTGKDGWRNYSHFGYLDPAQPTFAQALAAVGYRTFAAGKWQLVSNKYQDLEGMTPAAAGFQDYALWQIAAREGETDRYWGPTITGPQGPVPHRESEYGPELFSAALAKFIRESAASGQPFLAYYPMVLPHRPFSGTPGQRDGDRQQRFSAMIEAMDSIVGQLREVLEESGVADNTLLLFVGDNGTDRKITSRRNGQELRGGKALTLQSSTHVPFIAWWPGTIAPGSSRDELVYLADILPTLLELGGAALPADIDGRSLLPLLRNEGSDEWRDSLFMHYDPRWSDNEPARYVFDAQWKLYEDGRFFNLQQDPLEQTPLALAELDANGAAAQKRLQQHLELAGGSLSGVLSPQSEYRRERDLRRSLIAISVLLVLGFWYFMRRSRRA
ncbi:sulfatase-like hydrolase/transferase [Parahaliea sp. F7430]|uniref:Sulfatase-like hydrolase/transferase n=1 Tax=Sediminihaliea albiluteola TaxID=2758564 RepID=A0A7W2TX91_9GAMM|nr:sulfatase-like hydrolase/transferase [Sediminihaliea albiluteola]MBA6413504.1 sulfatase-like hydrolase/transferase [Sediminihaliea albiluteola]